MLSSCQINEMKFQGTNTEENVKNILTKLILSDRNFYSKFHNIFMKVYLEIIGDIKSKIFQIFYTYNHDQINQDFNNNYNSEGLLDSNINLR